MTVRMYAAEFALAVAVTLVGIIAGCASQDLGHGYRLVRVTAINPPGAFEAVAHHDELYYRIRKLGRVGAYDVSPSGRYAVFELDGTLRLFDKRSNRVHDLTDGEFAIPNRFDWDELAGVLEIEYDEGHAPSQIVLPVNGGGKKRAKSNSAGG